MCSGQLYEGKFGKYGNVYRIGGDEFVVIITGNTKEFQSIIESFDRRVAQWHGKLVDSMTISWGYVFSSEKEWDNIYDIKEQMVECIRTRNAITRKQNSQTKVTDCVFLIFSNILNTTELIEILLE